LLVLIVVLWPQIKQLSLTAKAKLAILGNIRCSAFELFLLIILLVHLALEVIYALSPPTLWDTVVYHLATVKSYLQQHQIMATPYLYESYYPATMEMLFLLGMLIRGEILANLINYLMGILSILAIYAFCRRYFSWRIGLWAAVVFYAMPVVTSNAGQAGTDMGLVFYSLLAIYALFNWLDSHKTNSLILAAIFCGLSAAIKYNEMIMPFLLGLGVMVKMLVIDKKRLLVAFRPLATFAFVAFMVASPWYVKNYLTTGDPVFPFLYKFFTGKVINPAILVHLDLSSLRSFRDYLLFPWDFYVRFRGVAPWDQASGPVYLMFIPCLLFLRGVDKRIKYLLLFVAGYALVWMAMPIQFSRYFLPCSAALSIVAGYAISRVAEGDWAIRRVALAFVMVVFCFNAMLLLAKHHFRIPVVLGIETRQSFLTKRVDSYKAIEYINSNLSDSEKVLLFEPRSYYVQRPYIKGDPQFQMMLDYTTFSDADDLLRELKQLGITHLLLNSNLLNSFSAEAIEGMRPSYDALHRLLNQSLYEQLELLHTSNNTFVYRINFNAYRD
ncbi:MAG: glycosyltransferase family 39 protein, partial [Candidatus Omnitrophica bacterium]|nr:glycosyltransferase family 39 protein [Candidatus Omnitrophota bacterium]